MKKKMTIILGTLGVIILVIVVFLLWKNRYGAKLYDSRGQANGWVRAEFIEKNRVYGSYYFNPECLEDSDEHTEENIEEKFSPSTRTYLIKDTETYEKIFCEEAPSVDFEKEMVVLSMFTAYNVRQYHLTNVTVKGDKMEIGIDTSSNLLIKDATRGNVHYVVIKLKKQDVDKVVVKRLSESKNKAENQTIYPLSVPEGVTGIGEYSKDGYKYTYYLEFEDDSVRGASITIHTEDTFIDKYKRNYSHFQNYGNITDLNRGPDGEIGGRELYFTENYRKRAKIRDEWKQGDTIIKIDKDYSLSIDQITVDESVDLPTGATIYYRKNGVYYIVKFGKFSEVKSNEWLLSFGLDLTNVNNK